MNLPSFEEVNQNPGREFYVLHMDREKLDIAERIRIGIRVAQ